MDAKPIAFASRSQTARDETSGSMAKTQPMPKTLPRRRKAAAAHRRAAPQHHEVDLGPLPDLIGFMLRRAQIAVFHEVFRLFSQVDIRPAQFSVLTVIERNPGLTQSQVA